MPTVVEAVVVVVGQEAKLSGKLTQQMGQFRISRALLGSRTWQQHSQPGPIQQKQQFSLGLHAQSTNAKLKESTAMIFLLQYTLHTEDTEERDRVQSHSTSSFYLALCNPIQVPIATPQINR